jgi:hypothetical protein
VAVRELEAIQWLQGSAEMGNGALAIGPKLPRPSSTLPELNTTAAQQFLQLVSGSELLFTAVP